MWRQVRYSYKSDQIFTIVNLQFKTGVRMPLTSQIKELGVILQKLFKCEPGVIQVNNDDKHLGLDGDADVLTLDELGAGLGATKQRKGSHKNCKNKEKKAVLNLSG